MADISQIEVNGTTYDICDATARDSLSQNYIPTYIYSSLPNSLPKLPCFVLNTNDNGLYYYDINMSYTRLNRKRSSDILLAWGAYDSSSGTLALSHPITDYDFVVFRFGYDAPDNQVGGMYNVIWPIFDNLTDIHPNLNVGYIQGSDGNVINKGGSVKIANRNTVTIYKSSAVSGSPILRTVVGIKLS